MQIFKSNPTNVLVIEDERDIRELMVLHLLREGFTSVEAYDGEEGLKKAQNGSFQLIILDWMLPKLSGLEVTRALRQNLKMEVPILMVTARVESADIVLGLESGADDYLTKPFDVPVFLARVRAQLRRGIAQKSPKNAAEKIFLGDLQMDLAAHEVFCHNEKVDLTPSEFNLLLALVRNRGRVLTRDKLIDMIRGIDISIVNRAIDTHVFGLRKKLGSCADIVETVRGIGYRIKIAEE